MLSQICWWEYNELLEHLHGRPDIWETDGQMWVRHMVGGDPALVLQFIEPENPGPYRMYTLSVTPVGWSEADSEDYVEKLVFFWSSYSFRLEAESLLKSELKLDDETAYLMAIALQRAQIEPRQDPEKESIPRQQLLYSDIPQYVHTQGVLHQSFSALQGHMAITKHAGQLRVEVTVMNPYPANGPHSFLLSGYIRPHGYTIHQFTRLMDQRKQEVLETNDPDSQVDMEALFNEQLANSIPDTGDGARSDAHPAMESPAGEENPTEGNTTC